jgi:hypothetical protein
MARQSCREMHGIIGLVAGRNRIAYLPEVSSSVSHVLKSIVSGWGRLTNDMTYLSIGTLCHGPKSSYLPVSLPMGCVGDTKKRINVQGMPFPLSPVVATSLVGSLGLGCASNNRAAVLCVTPKALF